MSDLDAEVSRLRRELAEARMERDILKKPRALPKRRCPVCAQNELVHHRRYEMREQAKREITEHIGILYNRQRRHSRRGNLSPAAIRNSFTGSNRQRNAATHGAHYCRPTSTE